MYYRYELSNTEDIWTVGCDLCKLGVKVIQGGPKNGQNWCGCRHWSLGEVREARSGLER